MKKLKVFMCVALFGAMSFGAFSVYDYYTMSVEEKAFLENVEALTSGEPGGGDGDYERTTGKCPPPQTYRTWQTCRINGNDACMPSDC